MSPSCPHHSPQTLRHFVSHPSHQLRCEATWARGCGTRCWPVSRTGRSESDHQELLRNVWKMFLLDSFLSWWECIYIYIYLCVCMIINHHRRVYLFHWHWKHREKNWRRWGTLSWTNRGAEVKYVQKRNHVAGKQQPAKISRTEICQRWGNAASCKREWTQRLRKMRTS